MQGTYLQLLPKDLRGELIRFGGYWPTYLERLPPELIKELENYHGVWFTARTTNIHRGTNPNIHLENLIILDREADRTGPGRPPLVIPEFASTMLAFYGLLAGYHSLISGDVVISGSDLLRVTYIDTTYTFSEQTRRIFDAKVAKAILDLAGDSLGQLPPRYKSFFERVAKGEDDA